MGVYWYDEALVGSLRKITGDDRTSILPTDSLFRYIANLKQDNVVLPLIAVTRLGYTLQQTGRTPSSSQGYPISMRGGEKLTELQFIPISIDWQLDIITRRRLDNDQIVDEILFYYINNPTLLVEIKKGANVSHKFSILFNPNIVDNSDIESHMSRGEYFRSTLTLTSSDAKLWKTTKKPEYFIDPIRLVGTTNIGDRSKDYIDEIIHTNNKENV